MSKIVKFINDRKQNMLVDTADTFTASVYENNIQIIPTSATLTVTNPGTSTVLVDGAAMTVAADGLMTYALTATHNDIACENYKAVVSYVYNAVTYSATLFYDVVRSKLHEVITDADIVAELPQLKDNGWRVHGTADSGSATTIVDTELIRYEDDYFTGGTATIPGDSSIRKITDFVSSTGTVTTDAFEFTVSTENYILTRSYEKEIRRAWESLEDKIRQQGKRPALILDPYDLREVHIYMTVAQICKGMVTEAQLLWWDFKTDYEKKAYHAFKDITFKYDESDDGVIVGSEENVKLGVRRIQRG